jgi:hypothetical protein
MPGLYKDFWKFTICVSSYLYSSYGSPIFEWLDPNWSILWVVEADQRFVKRLKIDLWLHTIQIFVQLKECANLNVYNANILYFASSFFYHKIV